MLGTCDGIVRDVDDGMVMLNWSCHLCLWDLPSGTVGGVWDDNQEIRTFSVNAWIGMSSQEKWEILHG